VLNCQCLSAWAAEERQGPTRSASLASNDATSGEEYQEDLRDDV
jgi:hypothetical protein